MDHTTHQKEARLRAIQRYDKTGSRKEERTMPVFQVTSISSPSAIPPKKRARRLPYQWYVVTRALIGGIIGGLLFALLLNIFGHPESFFIFLPVLVSLTWAQPLRYNIGKFLSSTPLYLLLTTCFTIIYYSAITLSQLVLYQDPALQIGRAHV